MSKLVISSASFYFWMKKFCPIEAISLTHKNLVNKFNGIDIYIDPNQFNFFYESLNAKLLSKISDFNYKVLHTDFSSLCDWEKNPLDINMLEQILKNLFRICKKINANDLVIHANYLIGKSDDRIRILKNISSDFPVSLELVDSNYKFGTRPNHFHNILPKAKNFFITPDLAHMQDFDYSWEEVFFDDLISKKIRVIHLSNHTKHLKENWYEKHGFNESKDANHSFCIAKKDNFTKDLFKYICNKHIVLEGIIPVGPEGLDYLDMEVNWVNHMMKDTTK